MTSTTYVTLILREKYINAKWITRIRKLKKDRHYNGQKNRDKSTNSDLQNTTPTKYWVIRATHKPEVNLCVPEE
jgi:hypothetical protein